MQQFADSPVRVFVVWEPVLSTDWGRPSTAALARISDHRASQFWDKELLISHSIGAHNRRNVVWDYIAVYPRGAVWDSGPPEALYHGGPVVQVTAPARAALKKALAEPAQTGNMDVKTASESGDVDALRQLLAESPSLANTLRIPAKAVQNRR